MSVQRDRAMNRIKELDSMACEANSHWNRLETMKEDMVREAGISPARLKAAGIFVRGEGQAEKD